MVKFVGSLWIVLYVTFSHASEDVKKSNPPFLNLSLSYFTEEGYPASWYIEAPQDSIKVKQSFADDWHGVTLEITSTDPVVMYTPILVDECIEKLAARVRVRSSGEVLSAVFFINPNEGRPNAAQLSMGNELARTISHQIISKNGCFNAPILMGIMTKGVGSINVSQFELDINGERFNDGNIPSEDITIEQLKELKRHTIKVKSLNLNQPNPELEKMKPWLTQAKVIGLGENSHGAKHLFLLKSKLIRYLVNKQGFTQLALEMPAITALTVDNYIQGKHDDRNKTLLALNYPSWQTKSMMELIDWLRKTNKTRDIPVSFSGFDIQQPQLTITELRSRVTKIKDNQATQLLEELTLILSEQTENNEKLEFTFQKLESHFEENIPSLKKYIEVLKQGVILERPGFGQGSRSEFMASQVLQLSRTQKTILWGDNTHITKQASAMGSYIAASLAEKYKAVGFSFHKGAYSAYGPNNPYSATPSFRGSHEFILNQLKIESLLLNLSHLPDQSPLLDLREFRYLGSRPQHYTQFYPHRLKEHFDIIGFVKSTEHTSYLVKHKFE